MTAKIDSPTDQNFSNTPPSTYCIRRWYCWLITLGLLRIAVILHDQNPTASNFSDLQWVRGTKEVQRPQVQSEVTPWVSVAQKRVQPTWHRKTIHLPSPTSKARHF